MVTVIITMHALSLSSRQQGCIFSIAMLATNDIEIGRAMLSSLVECAEALSL